MLLGELKVLVDTAPVIEKPLAQLAGIGWQAKHTNRCLKPINYQLQQVGMNASRS